MLRVHKERRVRREPLVFKAQLVRKVRKELSAHKVRLVFKVRKALLVVREQ